ncbi:MAG: autotransporter domain-containing protein, partial [Nevskiaceae bacterium]|nr:autotransporter domain-containing protein [Nevskiaceae bacterium]
LLTAAEGVNGAFNALTTNLVFIDPQLIYDPNNVALQFVRNDEDFEDIGDTENEQEAGGGTDSLDEGHPIWDEVVWLDEDQARDAFDQLSGEIHASIRGSLIESSGTARQMAMSRLWEATCGVSNQNAGNNRNANLHCGDDDRSALWIRGIGSWASANTNGNAAKFARSTGGFFFGGDGALTSSTRLGLFSGFNHSTFDVKARNSNGDSKDYHLGAYIGSQQTALAVRVAASYTFHQINTRRAVAFGNFSDHLSAQYNAGTAQVSGELGHSFVGARGSIEPFVNAAYVNLRTQSFTERGGPAALRVQGNNTDGLFSTLGLHWASAVDAGNTRITATGTLGWRHAFSDTVPTASMSIEGGDAFRIAGAPLARNAALADLGLNFTTGPNSTLGIAYNGVFGSDFTDNGARLTFRLRF